MKLASPTLSVTPIGFVRSPYGERAEAPRQPRLGAGGEGEVVLYPGRGFEDALSDLECWDHIWLVFWFDRGEHPFTPRVSPPRSAVKRGLFATRAPYRPNPIGISAVPLLAIDVPNLTLRVSGLDLLDQTPILDIKPYVPYADSIPHANHGWLDEAPQKGTAPRDPGQQYTVAFEPLAATQLAYLRDAHGVDLQPRIEAQLSLGPSPHAYRRIRREGDRLRLALKDWRAYFRVEGKRVTVECIRTGYKPAALEQAPSEHRDFATRWC